MRDLNRGRRTGRRVTSLYGSRPGNRHVPVGLENERHEYTSDRIADGKVHQARIESWTHRARIYRDGDLRGARERSSSQSSFGQCEPMSRRHPWIQTHQGQPDPETLVVFTVTCCESQGRASRATSAEDDSRRFGIGRGGCGCSSHVRNHRHVLRCELRLQDRSHLNHRERSARGSGVAAGVSRIPNEEGFPGVETPLGFRIVTRFAPRIA